MHKIDYRYLRPKKAAWLKTMYDAPFALREELSVWRGENAVILPAREIPGEEALFGRGGVVEETGQYVALSGIKNRIENSYPFESPEYRDEKVVYCGFMVNHWGHFLVEAVTRLWYALRNDTSIDKYVFTLNENEEREIRGNYKEFLVLLNIWDKIEFINTPTRYREVVVPECAFFCPEYYSPKFLEIFDALAENVKADPQWPVYDRIYFTRSHFAKENGLEFGLDSLDNFFQKNGFAILAPEKIPLPQMNYTHRHAKDVASMSGSTPHNMLFANSGQQLILMERLVMNDDHQVCINQMRQLQVTPIDASFHIYPVDFCGPYILGCNDILQQYIADHGMVAPDPEYTSEKYLGKCFKQYMHSYQENYRNRWFMADWYTQITDSLWEAYQDSYRYFHAYLDGEKPYLREHYFQIHYWKQWLKQLFRKS